MAQEISEKGNIGANGLIYSLSSAMGLMDANSDISSYKPITLANGVEVSLRISNHHASAINFIKKNEWAEGINPELQEKYGKKNRYKLWQGEGKITHDNVASAIYDESGIYLNELRKLPKLFGGFDGKLNDAQATIENAKTHRDITPRDSRKI